MTLLILTLLLAPMQDSAALDKRALEPVWPDHPLILPDKKGGVKVEIANPSILGSIKHSVRQRLIYFTWVYEVEGLTNGMGDSANKWKHLQTVPVAFTPTEVACLDENVVGIAGVDENGDTIFEQWTLESPPDQRATTPVAGGPLRIPKLEIKILERRVLYRTPSEGRRYIGAIYRNWGLSQRPFVYLTDTSELFTLDRKTGKIEKVASPTDSTVLLVPELSTERFVDVGSVVHSSLGALYWLIPAPKTGKMVFLIDADTDGVLDRSETLSRSKWGDTAHSDFESYLIVR